jgi:hypothetical protein
MVRKLGLTKRSKEDFYTHLRNASPEINLCRDIAEFYKHLELRRPDATIFAVGVSVAHAVALAPATFVYTPSALEVKSAPLSAAPEEETAATSEPTPDAVAIEAEDSEVTSAKTSRSLTVRIRLRDGRKRVAAEVVEKAIKDWDGLLTSGNL